jgi:hypothetical protein
MVYSDTFIGQQFSIKGTFILSYTPYKSYSVESANERYCFTVCWLLMDKKVPAPMLILAQSNIESKTKSLPYG